jgi:hypothetical protein
MKVPTRIAAIACIALMLQGCTSTQFKDISIDSEANPKVELKGYDSYAWAGAAAVVRDPDREWTPVDLDVGAEIRHLVDRELRDKGLTQVATDPDMLVIYGVGVDMKALENVEVDEENAARFEEVPKGGVLVVFIDPQSRQVIWAGAAEAEIMEKPDRELAKRRLDYAITKMLKGFPG